MNSRVIDIASVITMVLAVLLVGFPLMFLYFDLRLAGWSDVVVGLIVFGLAFGRNRGWGRWASWINLILGVYLLLLPYTAGFFTTVGDLRAEVASFVNVVWGLAIIGLSAWDLFGIERPQGEVPVFTSAEPGERD